MGHINLCFVCARIFFQIRVLNEQTISSRGTSIVYIGPFFEVVCPPLILLLQSPSTVHGQAIQAVFTHPRLIGIRSQRKHTRCGLRVILPGSGAPDRRKARQSGSGPNWRSKRCLSGKYVMRLGKKMVILGSGTEAVLRIIR